MTDRFIVRRGYKKNDPLLKTNYRPVSVLHIFSKIFEKILEQQALPHDILLDKLSAYGMSTDSVSLLESYL